MTNLTSTEERILTDVKYGVSGADQLADLHDMTLESTVDVLRSLRYKGEVTFEGGEYHAR